MFGSRLIRLRIYWALDCMAHALPIVEGIGFNELEELLKP